VTHARKIAAVAAFAAAATLAVAGPGSAATGLGGYVTDGDSGLGVNQASVSFVQDGSSATPSATTDPTGRYLFAALSGVTGRLSVVGPPGWLSAEVGGIAVPTLQFVQRDVTLRRNWAAVPGGARLAGATDAGTPECAPGAALDGDRASGWSAAAPAPEADAPTLTVELPTAVDVEGIGLEAGAVCGDDPGAALGRYTVQTSPDGATWTTAADGQLAEADRGVPVVMAPSAGAAQVRFVRVALLGAQDPAATRIDLRELQVLGKGPNQPPRDGSVTLDVDRVQPKALVRLTASFTDTDSSIVHYLWDFDGDNAWDQATLGPRVSHVWSGSGTYQVSVGARDFRGALGVASRSVRVAAIGAPVEPILDRKPILAFDPADGPSVPFRVRCSLQCRVTGDLTITRALARRLGLRSRRVARINKVYAGGGLADYRLTLNHKVVRRLQRTKLRKIRAVARVKVLDAKKRAAKRTKRVTLR
jgi:F5/8 type C domain/PKD domain